MNKQTTLRTVLITAITLTLSQSLWALDFLGPPVSQLDKGKWSVGAEYSTGEMEFKAKGWAQLYQPYYFPPQRYIHVHRIHMKDFKTHKTYGAVGYGLTDSWDLTASLGTVKSSWDYTQQTVTGLSWSYRQEHEESRDPGFSLGIHKTLFSKGKFKVGALAKYSYLRMDEAHFHTEASNRIVAMAAELAMDEYQIALGASYDISKQLSLYGGPFIRWIDGELKNVNIPLQSMLGTYTAYGSYDLNHMHELGGYIGAQAKLHKNASFNIEYQRTSSADCLGMSMLFRCK